MEIVKDTQFEFGRLVCRVQPPDPSMLIVMKATFKLEHGVVAQLADAQQPCTGDVLFDEAKEEIKEEIRKEIKEEDDLEAAQPITRSDSDFGFVKPRGEFVVIGSCHPPEPVAISGVAMQVGRIQKSIGVYGDRQWKRSLLGTKPTAPKVFSAMPLRWDRAYGGPGYEANPVGLGREAVAGVRKLPNLEDPKNVLMAPDQTIVPTGCGAIPQTWKQRLSKAGTYDQNYLDTRFPWLAADFDPEFFMAAPQDQQNQGYWNGDEWVILLNLHREHSRIETRLPAVRARCFLERVSGANGHKNSKGDFEEVSLHLDTITVDADQETILCLWRGRAAIADEKMTDVARLFLMDEPTAHQTPISECRRRMHKADEQQRASLEGGAHEAIPSIHDPLKPPPEDRSHPTLFYPPKQEWAPSDDVRETGFMPVLTDDVIATRMLPKPSVEDDDGADLERATTMNIPVLHDDAPEARPTSFMQKISVGHSAQQDQPEDQREDEKKDHNEDQGSMPTQVFHALNKKDQQTDGDPLERLIADMKQAGIEVDLVMPKSEPVEKPAGPPNPSKIREAFKSMGQPVPDEVEELIEDLEHAEETIETQRKSSSSRPAEPDAVALEEQVVRAHREGKAIVGDFSGVDLQGLNLSGLIARGALLDRANLRGANLSDAHFEEASLVGACFDDANLVRSSWVDSNLSEGSFERSQLEDAILDGAVCSDANFHEAQLSRASLNGADFQGANLDGAVLNDAQCAETDFTRASMINAICQRASMVEARMNEVVATGIDLSDCNLERFRASGKGSFAGAMFRKSLANGSRFRGVDLHGANFSFSELDDADFSEANLTGALLEGCSLKKSRFLESCLVGAQVLRSNVLEGSFQDADLSNADLRGSNFYAAEFWRAKVDGTQFELANLKGTKLEKKGR